MSKRAVSRMRLIALHDGDNDNCRISNNGNASWAAADREHHEPIVSERSAARPQPFVLPIVGGKREPDNFSSDRDTRRAWRFSLVEYSELAQKDELIQLPK